MGRRTTCNGRRVIGWAWILTILLPLGLNADDVRVAPAAVSAAGRRTAVVTVPRFGRYSLAVASKSGVALTVVDRMSGPGRRMGTPGETDGRADLFLDRGEVRLVLNGDPKSKGRATLSARPFVERNGAAPPRLLELKTVETTLSDYEQRSWWISIESRRRVAFEAAGRRLTDLRLWRDGSWLDAAEPESEVTMPQPGRPMRVMRLAADLAPGLYLLSAYGGPGEPWAEESDASPLHLRWGIPRFGVAGRARHLIGASGIDRYLVAGPATFFNLEVPEARAISFTANPWAEESPFVEGEERGAIDKKTNPPEAALRVEARTEGLTLVTVRGEAGQPYVLTHFELLDRYPIRGTGDYWIATIPSADVRDAIDQTGLLLDDVSRSPLRKAAVEIDRGKPWAGRGNLDGELSLFFQVGSAGKYVIDAAGVDAKIRVLPALGSWTPQLKPLELRGRGTVDLDPGYWQLTAQPVKKGIVTLALHAEGEKAPAPSTPRGGILFPSVPLSDRHGYDLVVGVRPRVVSGLVLRSLPMDLTDPLPVAARPGQTVSVPFEAAEEVTLAAETEDGAELAISVDGAPATPRARVAKGRHEAKVTLAGDVPRVFSIAARPLSLEKDVPLPPLPDGALAALPKFPALLEGTALGLDLAQEEAATYGLTVRDPGLYRIETTGLLATNALLRTRTVTSFRSEGENGVGRNALVADFLREGDYQVTVQPRGRSAGHLGVVLSKTTVVDGGAVTDGVPARLSLDAGEAAALKLVVARAGTYRIRALGLKRKFAVRLEDSEGWPFVKPGIDGDLRRTFAKGTYRLVVLPTAVPARVVVTLDRLPRPLVFRGHGPHALPLGKKAVARWMESADGAERIPDRFHFTLPARAAVKVVLTAGMEGKLIASEATPLPVPAGREFQETLDAGSWTLEAVSARRDNRVEYEVAVEPGPLVAGLDRDVTAPAEVSVAIGEAGLYKFTSSGDDDVRARLLDAGGSLVAENDDRSDDWNFAITRPLAPGTYTLRVDPAGTPNASCTVALRRLEKTVAAAEPLPIARELSPGRGVVEIPVNVPAGTLLEIAAEAAESVGIGIAGEDGTLLGQATGRAPRVAVPAFKAGLARLSLFSDDGRGGEVRFSAKALPMAEWKERQLAKGGTPPGGAVVVVLDHPGVLRFDSPVRVSAAAAAPALPAEGLVAANGESLVVATEGAVRATRVRLDEQEITLDAREARIDLAPAKAKGPVLVRARAALGQPGLALPRGAATAGERSGLAAALDAPKSVALAGDESLSDVVLSRVAFVSPKTEPLEKLSVEGAVAARGARAFSLPTGAKRMRVALGAGLVALVTRSGEGLALLGAMDTPSDETLDTNGDRITFLEGAGAEARFALDVFEKGEAPAALAPGAPLDVSFPDAGTLRVPVAAPAAGETRKVRVRGASGPATLLSSDGRSARGTDLEVPAAGGTLLVPHAPGLVLAWVDRAGREAEDLFGSASDVRTLGVRPPAAPALSGLVTAFDVDAEGPALVSLRAPGPALTLVASEGATPEVAIHEAGVSLDAYVPSGKTRVLVRALGGGTLGGLATFTATPVTKIGEGLGPEALLGAGQVRLYGFHVARWGTVGLGVRADSDIVSATLLSPTGARLGDGLVQMPELAAGDYLLSVRAPSDSAPIRIRPAVAGIEPPGGGPPPDVIRTYVLPEGEVQGMSATRLEEGESEGETEEEAESDVESEEEDAESEDGAEEPADDASDEGEPQ